MSWPIRTQSGKETTMMILIQKIIVSILLFTLCASCAAAPSATRSSTVISITATPTLVSIPTIEKLTPARKPAGKQPKNGSSQPGRTAPASSFMPSTSTFNIVLGRPTSSSIAANLYALQDSQVSLAYRSIPGNGNDQIVSASLKAKAPQTLTLTGLSPDTEYSYNVTVNGAQEGEHSFHTQRTPGSAFTFTIDADPHGGDPNFNGELYATTLINALKDKPDFHIDLGDTFMTEKARVQTYSQAESTFTDMRPYFGILAPDTPLFLVNGNHEGELGWLLRGKDGQLATWSAQLRQLYYPNPIPGGFYSGASSADPTLGASRDGYYSWTWGDALFVVLDPFWYTTSKPQPSDLNNNWNWTLGKAQYDWLKSTLESSQAKYKFIFTHHLVGGGNTDARGGIDAAPYFEWGGKNADGTDGFAEHRPGWGKPIHQLLVENHISAVFHGHDHVFVKQELDGIIYQEVPQPSTTQYDKTSLATDYGYRQGTVFGSSGHLRVTVSPDRVVVAYIRAYLLEDEKQNQQNDMVEYEYVISS
jgi:hypothetical protein